jgi:hypothetical protein
MPVYLLDTAFEVEELNGVAAHRVVVRGTQPNRCAYPAGANAADILGVTTDLAGQGRGVAVRRLGKAMVEAAGVIAAGSRVCIADNQGRVKAAVRASAVTGVVGNNNAIRWTARPHATAGNAIVVDIVVAGTDTPLSMSVSGNTITINAATDGGGAATTTAAEAIAAVAAHAAAGLLVTGQNEDPSLGTGAVADETVTLSGGEGGLNPVGIAEQSAGQAGDLIDVFLTP